jgi:hypothetical protein
MMTRTTIERLAAKTLDQRFQHELETGIEIAPRVAQGILNLAKEVFGLDSSATNHDQLRPGQIRQVVATSNAVHGPPHQAQVIRQPAILPKPIWSRIFLFAYGNCQYQSS